MSLSIPFPFWWLLNKEAVRVEVNISLAFLHWVGIAIHPGPFISYIAIFVLKRDVNLQLTFGMSGTTEVSYFVLNLGLNLPVENENFSGG